MPGETKLEKEHFKRTRALAGECMVLLKNDGSLPLKAGGKIALYGEGARNTVRGGTGSGMTITRHAYSIEEGLELAGFQVTTKDWLDRQDARRRREFAAFLKKTQEEGAGGGLALMLASGDMPAKETEAITKEDMESSESDTAIFVLARSAGEGDDRKCEPGDYELAESEKRAIEFLAGAYDKFILVLNVCGPVETAWIKSVDGINAILLVGQQGAPGGLSVADVLCGEQVPSGKLADTWALSYQDYSTAKNFGYQEGNMDDVYYEEGIYVGYRYFDTFGVEPGYPFGFGLSYTSFSMKTVDVWADEREIVLKVKVENTGKVFAGKEVVQVYASAPDGKLEKPYQELKAYAKTDLLEPTESQILTIRFPTVSLASYSADDAAYLLEEGGYYLRVGNSSRSTTIAACIRMEGTVVVEQLKNLFADSEAGKEISKEGIKPWCYEEEEEEKKNAMQIVLSAGDFVTKKPVYSEAELLKDMHPETVITAEDVLAGCYTAEELTAQLTIEEMAYLTTGNCKGLQYFFEAASDYRVPGSAAQTTDICLESRDIREHVCSDGPAGLHVDPEFVVYQDGSVQVVPQKENPDRLFDHTRDSEIVEHHYQPCTAFPVSSTAALSWNLELFAEISRMYGREMKEIWMQTALKPSMNLHRDPLGGRNFEYYSEDPLLTGTYAAADILALQKYPGITGTVKHFAVNSNERNRMHSCAHVSERALREIYLKGFEIAIRTAQPGCIMSSYNLINGVHAANSKDLLTYVCRDEWGYEGMIMTDWLMTETGVDMFSAVDREKPLRYGNTISHLCTSAGNDIIMPGSDHDREDIIACVKDGTVALADLQRCALHVLRLILRSDLYEGAESYYVYVGTEPEWVRTEKSEKIR